MIALPDDEIDTSDAPELDWKATKPDEEEHNFFKDYGFSDADERFGVYKMFRCMYGENAKGFPKFYAGYRLGCDDGPNLEYLLETAIKATCYIAEKIPEDDQRILASRIFQLLPQIIFKSQEKDDKPHDQA